jgi:hypothetical protein
MRTVSRSTIGTDELIRRTFATPPRVSHILPLFFSSLTFCCFSRERVVCGCFWHFRSDGAALGSRRSMLNHIASAVEWSATSGGASFDMQRKVAVVRIAELTEGASVCAACV